jgi:hypothetical protein
VSGVFSCVDLFVEFLVSGSLKGEDAGKGYEGEHP